MRHGSPTITGLAAGRLCVPPIPREVQTGARQGARECTVANLADLRFAITTIQHEKAVRNEARNLGRVGDFVNSMEQYEKIIEIFLNSSEVMEFLLQVARNHFSVFDDLNMRNNFLSIVKSLLYQLCYGDDRLAEYLDAEISTSGEATLNRTSTAKTLLEVVGHSKDSLFIIIDGLDECIKTEKKQIISWVQSLASNDGRKNTGSEGEPSQIRCLLVGQEDSECTKLLKGCHTVKIQPTDNIKDIGAFCMFLFAKLFMHNILSQTKEVHVRNELKWLEEDSQKLGVIEKLEEAYGRMIRRMEQDMDGCEHEDALRILAWITLAKRDLQWHRV
ncbi:hypothetical protein B0H63DRAFT_518052 [Podospora didyma]|uniref:Nephrocystin 3-like N-terminal domain-containing protein n=1 Tax=Podospora didyma TaxID=330526 RepID=A0AAE0P853_9PEZI|nr:hypothetical protein B0H63DRAFT_518052 [Podospora didyma]